ncbi:ly49 inhibitory receptor 7 isoform X2 [Rattus norvegicus]|uniref:ly49 inhibitory receptor 7 isoform X2 n=1 Tax=Rattus norvegicus TaxID=10116 RepID=UPI001917588A|nr:ly49 inhibitory receptor 7 isoform X2 [Rattus norvegicus]
MSEQEVTYSSLRFSKSSRLHNQVKPEETRGPREAGHRECYVPWHLIVIALGILCTLLLVTVAVLVTNSNEIETHWFCYGIKCYYFIKDRKTWHGCKRICQNSNLSLLKIDDEDERKFLQQQVIPDNYWIGLSYEKEKNKWAWIENGPSELASNTKIFNERDGACVFLSKTKLDSIDCNNLYSCICGKRLNKFPDLLFNEC